MSLSRSEEEKENAPPAKRLKGHSLQKGGDDAAVRTFKLKTLGGEEFEVSLPGDSTVGDLEVKVAKARGLGLCFTLIGGEGQLLTDISAPLPKESQVTCQVENPAKLCKAAQKVLKRAVPYGKECRERREVLHLGRCRRLGAFPGSKWKKGGVDSVMSDVEDVEDESDGSIDSRGDYYVYEFTLIDGDDKPLRLIGVINEGRLTGMWGSVYLRPSLREVGTIRAEFELSDESSIWSIEDDSWYTAPATTLPHCTWVLFGGGGNAKTPLQNHLALALQHIYQGTDAGGPFISLLEGSKGDEDEDEDAEEDTENEGDAE
eukprot:gnl/TRDRNA2_/TRDRNA2_59428_c0_seq1.p1 gnl/TRDRNA2_/TRDRNA2_59428_c0~~gnl/TRDRNA2_/TRDRNA2_59428_c0_seq1.p1  ORF type:complete len:317 (-),score=54.13 gnl/TRDRNA2_/TRDRNA2_59428_c0_seq1:191-1141(-)